MAERPSQACQLSGPKNGLWCCSCGWAPHPATSNALRDWTEHTREKGSQPIDPVALSWGGVEAHLASMRGSGDRVHRVSWSPVPLPCTAPPCPCGRDEEKGSSVTPSDEPKQPTQDRASGKPTSPQGDR